MMAPPPPQPTPKPAASVASDPSQAPAVSSVPPPSRALGAAPPTLAAPTFPGLSQEQQKQMEVGLCCKHAINNLVFVFAFVLFLFAFVSLDTLNEGRPKGAPRAHAIHGGEYEEISSIGAADQ